MLDLEAEQAGIGALGEAARAARFASVASAFCHWCEAGLNEPTSVALVREARMQIATLHAAALRLPEMDEIEAEDPPDAPEPPKRDAALASALANRFARLPVGYYRVFFNPGDLQDEEPCVGDLQDDLLEMHDDVRKGLWLHGQGHARAALREWRLLFDAHWGRHAVNALYALQGREC